MQSKKYKPLIDKLFYLIAIPTFIITLSTMVICGISAPNTLFVTVPIFLFTAYFFVSPLFGYVELGESAIYIKYGFIMSREISYEAIRKIERERKIISPSIVSIKNALDHINIKYNRFDITTVSLKDSDEFIERLNEKCQNRLP